jgi:hypothetical protein
MSTVIVPWYATGFRANAFEVALDEVAAVALRYGATAYAVYRSQEDTYRFQQVSEFPEHVDWERYWESPEMTDFRVRYAGWYQVPVLYGWWTCTSAGGVEERPTEGPATNGVNGHANGARVGRED